MHPSKYLVETRSVLTIYRDCFKLLYRMLDSREKIVAAQKLLRKQFENHKDQFDTDKINNLKMNAVKGISNYIIYAVQKDYKILNKQPINIMEEQDQLAHLYRDDQVHEEGFQNQRQNIDEQMKKQSKK